MNHRARCGQQLCDELVRAPAHGGEPRISAAALPGKLDHPVHEAAIVAGIIAFDVGELMRTRGEIRMKASDPSGRFGKNDSAIQPMSIGDALAVEGLDKEPRIAALSITVPPKEHGGRTF